MPRKPDPATLCQHHTKDGKRCRMPLALASPSLCAFHQRAAAKLAATQANTRAIRREEDSTVIAAELLADAQHLNTPTGVNLFLRNLLIQVAHNRIPRKRAITMAYITQLLLNSISVMQREARDAQAAKAQAAANEPECIVLNIPRPCRRRHVDDAANASRCSDESSDSHPSFAGHPQSQNSSAPGPFPPTPPEANPQPETPLATTPPAIPDKPAPDDPPPSTHPPAIPLPRWGELDPVTKYTYREPERRNTYGPPRMAAPPTRRRAQQRRRSRHNIQKQFVFVAKAFRASSRLKQAGGQRSQHSHSMPRVRWPQRWTGHRLSAIF